MATASLGRPPSLLSRLLESKTATAPRPRSPSPLLNASQCRTRLASTFATRLLLPLRERGQGSKPLFAFLDEERAASQEINGEESWMREDEDEEEEEEGGRASKKNYMKPCELYVCNLPRSVDIAELADMFSRFGTVTAVQVSKNPETGLSRGAAYVTMSSFAEARRAVAALEGTDVGGREIRVRYSAEMNRGNDEANSKMVTNVIYEGPYKLYVGNLGWSFKLEDVREAFREFGAVVSVRLVNDRRTGKLRCYAFVSYNTAQELEAALSMNGKFMGGRPVTVRRLTERWTNHKPNSAYP